MCGCLHTRLSTYMETYKSVFVWFMYAYMHVCYAYMRASVDMHVQRRTVLRKFYSIEWNPTCARVCGLHTSSSQLVCTSPVPWLFLWCLRYFFSFILCVFRSVFEQKHKSMCICIVMCVCKQIQGQCAVLYVSTHVSQSTCALFAFFISGIKHRMIRYFLCINVCIQTCIVPSCTCC